MNESNSILDSYRNKSQYTNYKVLDIILIEDEGYRSDMYDRPYSLNTDTHTLSEFSSELNQLNMTNRSNIGSGLVGRIGGGLIDINNSIKNKVLIPNGWGADRYRFFIVVECDDIKNSNIYYRVYLNGYSEASRLEEDQEFFINNICVVKYIEGSNLPPVIETMVSVNRNHNDSENIFDRYGDRYSNDRSLLDPRNVMLAISAGHDQYGEYDPSGIRNIKTNLGIIGNNRAKLSNNDNRVGARYISTLISSYRRAKNTDGYNQSSTIFGTAAANSSPRTNKKIPFISELSNVDLDDYSFVLSFIEHLDPDVGSPKLITAQGGALELDGEGVIDINNSVDMSNARFETKVAHLLTSGLSSLMIEKFVSNVYVIITNVNTSNRLVSVTDMTSFISELNDSDYIDISNSLEDSLEDLVVTPLLRSHEIDLTCIISANIQGETRVSIAINDDAILDSNYSTYVFPSFADGLYSPIVGTEKDRNNISSDTYNLLTLLDYNIG